MANSTSFLDRLAGRFRGKEKAAAKSYGELVVRVADGQDPDLAAGESILREANKTTADLGAAVQRLRERRTAAAAVERGQAARQELEALHVEAGRVEAVCQAAVDKAARERGQAMDRLQQKQRELEAVVKAAMHGESLLRETADKSATAEQEVQLKERLAAAKRRRDAAEVEGQKAARRAHEFGAAAHVRSGGWFAPVDAQRRELLQRKEAEADAAAVELMSKAEGPAEEVRELEKQIAAVENMALAP